MQSSTRRVRRALAAVSVALIVFSVSPGAASRARAESRPSAAKPAPAPDWQTDAERSIAEREYEATDAGAGLQAPNRALDVRTYFGTSGARVVERTAEGSTLADVRTVSIGRIGRARPVEPGEVSSTGARVELRRAGGVEWFENSEHGLEHGWTLSERPDGAAPLAVEIAFGDATARVEAGRALLTAADGRRLEYGGLSASDANGTALAARMEAADDGRVRIVVDDASAAYPVTIDPTFSSPSFATIEADQTNAQLGTSVAGAGDTNGDGYDDVIVGAPLYDPGLADEGAAFVFLGGPNGIGSGGPAGAAATLHSQQSGAQFGCSVASAGDVNGDGYADVIVGAYADNFGLANEGAAFIWLGGPSGIQSGTPSSGAATSLHSAQAGAYFGNSVASAGDTNGDGYDDVIVGAPFYFAPILNEGAAFVFLGGPSGVADGTPANAAAMMHSAQQNARLGLSVASAGDTNGDGYADVIVGAPAYNAGQTNEGAAFVFLGSPFGILGGTPESAVVLHSGHMGATLGSSVASAGDTNGDGYADVIVGAPQYGDGQAFEGAAFVFLGGPGGIVGRTPATAAATIESDQALAFLGVSVASAGDINDDGYADVVVGANSYDAGQTDEGAAFVFLGGPAGVVSGNPTTAAAVLQADQPNAEMGVSVEGAGDTNGDGLDDVVVGASFYDAGETDEGAAFVYQGGPYGLTGYPLPASTLRGNQTNADLGYSVAGAGDVNNDGYADVIVGAPFYDAGQTDEGAAFVFLGGPTGIRGAAPATAATLLQSNQATAQMGFSVAGAGDVNGDGYADVIVGANHYSAGQTQEGAAFVFLGGPSGVASGSPASAAATLHSAQLGAQMGTSVASAGDVNNDGYADVIVGASNYDDGQPDEGAAFVFLGGPGGIASATPATASATIESDQAGTLLGYTGGVASAGDTNGDGYDDVIVGAYTYSAGQNFEGAAFIFLGGPAGVASGTPATAAATLQSDQTSALLGCSVAGAGDVNNDGYADVIVGARLYDDGTTDEGAAFVFLGGPSGVANGTPATAAATLHSGQASSLFGYSVAGAGDVDGDGYDDVIVGAPAYTSGASQEGAAFVFLGGPGGVFGSTPASAAVTFEGHQTDAEVGYSVAGAGDVNGDGHPDVIVGAPAYSAGEAVEGAAFVYEPAACCAVRPSSATVGVYAPATGAWFLRNTNTPGVGQDVFVYGVGGRGYVAIAGDWNGDGVDTPGLYDPRSGTFYLRNSNTPGPADLTFVFGDASRAYLPIAGDWNGDGVDTIGLYNPTTGTYFLKNANSAGVADLAFVFGAGGAGAKPVAGDWNGDGTDTVGFYVPDDGVFFLTNTNAAGPADLAFNFGPVGFALTPVAGDFDGDGTDSVGLYTPPTGTFFLENANAPGYADVVVAFGPPNQTPLIGDWDGMLHRAKRRER